LVSSEDAAKGVSDVQQKPGSEALLVSCKWSYKQFQKQTTVKLLQLISHC